MAVGIVGTLMQVAAGILKPLIKAGMLAVVLAMPPVAVASIVRMVEKFRKKF